MVLGEQQCGGIKQSKRTNEGFKEKSKITSFVFIPSPDIY